MSAVNTEAVRGLLAQLREVPNDTDTLAVLADWCEERGFEEAATNLRAGWGTGLGRTLYALQALFGWEGSGPEASSGAARYTAIAGLPRTEVHVAESVDLRTEVYAPFRLKRVVLQHATSLVVHVLRVGMHELIYNGAPVYGAVFSEHGPEICSKVVLPGQHIQLRVENISSERLRVAGCLLGDEPPEPPAWTEVAFPPRLDPGEYLPDAIAPLPRRGEP